MAAHSSHTTTSHKKIKEWVEAHDGKPATIAGTETRGEEVGMLRIDMPGGAKNPPLEPISWDDFFKKFDEANLAFVYQDKTADGKESHFCKFVSRDSAA
jgi:hypothetical protein